MRVFLPLVSRWSLFSLVVTLAGQMSLGSKNRVVRKAQKCVQWVRPRLAHPLPRPHQPFPVRSHLVFPTSLSMVAAGGAHGSPADGLQVRAPAQFSPHMVCGGLALASSGPYGDVCFETSGW